MPVQTEPAAPQPSPQVPDQAATGHGPPLVRLTRRLANPLRRREKQPEPSAAAEPEAPRVPGLAYLLIIGDEFGDDPGAWQRNRAALLKVDARIATLPNLAYLVRVLEGDAETLRGELREAGQLAKRDVRQQVADPDFAEVLTAIRTLLQRDLTHVKASGEPLAHPVIVFFASDPPFADSVAADVFSLLAQEASIIWVVPEDATKLLDSALTEPPHVHVLPDHEDMADQIAGLLVPASSTPP